MLEHLTLFYDDKCKFCKVSVYFIIRILQLPQEILCKGSSEEEILQIMDVKNSWILIDSKGKIWTKFSVFQKLIQNSLRFNWAYKFIMIKTVSTIGDLIYFVVARNRGKLSKLFD